MLWEILLAVDKRYILMGSPRRMTTSHGAHVPQDRGLALIELTPFESIIYDVLLGQGHQDYVPARAKSEPPLAGMMSCKKGKRFFAK